DVIRTSAAFLLWADLPDHACAWNLDKRCVGGIYKTGIAAGAAARVPHRAVIDNIGTAIGPEPDIRRSVEAGKMVRVDECLIASIVAREILERNRQRQTSVLVEVHKLDLVPDFRRRSRCIRRRESEVSFEAIERRAGQDGTFDKRFRDEV